MNVIMTGEDKKRVAIEFLHACEHGDIETAEGFIAQEFRFESMKRSGVNDVDNTNIPSPIYKDNFFPFAKAAVGLTQGGMNLKVELALVDGDHVVMFGSSNAITLSGATYQNAYCWHMEFAEGKIVCFREFNDTKLVDLILRS